MHEDVWHALLHEACGHIEGRTMEAKDSGAKQKSREMQKILQLMQQYEVPARLHPHLHCWSGRCANKTRLSSMLPILLLRELRKAKYMQTPRQHSIDRSNCCTLSSGIA